MESVFAVAAAYHIYDSLHVISLFSIKEKKINENNKKKLYVSFPFLCEFLPLTVTVAGREQSSELLSASDLT